MSIANTPIRIGKKEAKNRITMAPTVKFVAGQDGMVTEFFVRHYALRAKHGCGFICVEATCITPEGRLSDSQLGLWSDEQIEGHKRIADACHAYGALVVPQIHHGGLGTFPTCGPAVGPSDMKWRFGPMERDVHGLTKDEIKRIVGLYVDAAVRAQKAGYDGVQLHACHNYLINNFASDANRRTDEYGGSPENRARFGCEIIDGIRKACGEDFIISARVSGMDPTVEDSILVAEQYVKAGCDYLQVSNGFASQDGLAHDESLPYNVVASLGVRLHEHFRGIVPVSCVNGLRTPEQINYLLDNDLVDTVDLACGLLADPALTEAVLSGAAYHKCLSCKRCSWGPGGNHKCPAMLKRGVDEWQYLEK